MHEVMDDISGCRSKSYALQQQITANEGSQKNQYPHPLKVGRFGIH